MKHFIVSRILITIAVLCFVFALVLVLPAFVHAQETIDPDLLEAYAALEQPTEAQIAQGREWQHRGDVGLLRMPPERVVLSCGDPLGCVMFASGASRTRAFCTIVVPKDVPEFMAEAVYSVRLAECGRALTVANN